MMIVDDLVRRFGFDIVPKITDTKIIFKNPLTLMVRRRRNGRFKKVRAESATPAPLGLTMEHLHLQVKLGNVTHYVTRVVFVSKETTLSSEL